MKHTDSKLKVGVMVRFLNAKGGGRVSRISGDTAWVEDEDGFEIPTLTKECVVVDAGDTFMPAYKPPRMSKPLGLAVDWDERVERQAAISFKQQEELVLPKPHTFLPASGSVNAYLAFIPVDEKKLSTTNYEAYLINDSKYTLFYTYSNKEGVRWGLRSSGFVDPDSQYFLEEFSPQDINDLELLNIQLIAFAENPKVYHSTYSIELRLDGRKFFKLNSYETNDFFEESTWVETLVEDDVVHTRRPSKPSIQEITEAMQTPRKADIRPVATKRQSPTVESNDPLVVDLHIDALLDDTTGMNNAAILRYQLDKFNEVMQANLKKQGRKIVFIHGKGEGVLRNKIEGELKYRYADCLYQDASFKEYSYGATQVTIGELKKG